MKTATLLQFGFLAFALLPGACAPIQPYPIVVPLPRETLLPPSAQLDEYTRNPRTGASAGLTVQFARTTQQCGLVKQAIATEINLRERRLSSRNQGLLLVGSISALATTVYSGVVDNPRKEILVPLGAISGSSLVTALPTLGKDERVNALRETLTAIRTQETAAVSALNTLERALLDVALLEAQQENTVRGSVQWNNLQSQLDKKHIELAPQEDGLRTALAVLANECS